MRTWLITLLVMILFCQRPRAQDDYNFRHLGAEQGLSDGVIRAIGQDKYGYIWISTLGGLNRFDGYSVKVFYNDPTDSTSLPPHTVRSIFCDRQGRLWFGFDRGFSLYDYAKAAFISMPGADFYVTKISQLPSGLLLLNTGKGIQLFDPATRRFTPVLFPDGGLGWAYTYFADGDEVYLASHRGLWLYNAAQNKMRQLRTTEATAVAKDSEGHLWYVTAKGSAINHAGKDLRLLDSFVNFNASPTGYNDGAVNELFTDRDGNLWAVTNMNGLMKYNKASRQFDRYLHNPAQPTSISANLVTQIFQTAEGFICVGTEGMGLNYFHPDQRLFSQLSLPADWMAEMPTAWMRSLVVDKHGNTWIGATGLLQMSANGKPLRLFNNKAGQPQQLHNNSVRGLLADDEGNVWVGTREGVNKWSATSQRMLFLTDKDSLPRGFYWTLLQDNEGTIWLGERNNLFYWPKGAPTARTVQNHPALSTLYGRGVRSIFQDSKDRLWFGMNGSGLVMWDKKNGQVQQWRRSAGADTVLLNDLIVDIAEDKAGELWFSSFTGLTAYNPASKKFRWYTRANGLPSVKTSALLVDEKNRIWIGSTRGLLLLDSTVKGITSFTTADGLPSMEFSDMRGSILADGRFAMPTLKGYAVFDPRQYKSDGLPLRFWLSSVQYLGQETSIDSPEEMTQLSLQWDQNFFSLGMTAVHYNNPGSVWYAYKLDGFDKDWIYTKDRVANYTNVPGGRYTFRYKATTNPDNWNMPEKSITLHIGTVFYKAVWFWTLMLALTAAGLYYLYKIRMRQQQRIYLLQTKAQALEKEKTAVMYESLKQQLNPHFLFNSLTSLNSLIKVDQKLASAFLEGMSKIYRYLLKSRDTEVVPLSEELEFVQHYIALQRTRFESGFEVHVNVAETLLHKKLAPVTLQNLVENAIKHNIIDEESPLVVHIFSEGDSVIVQNNLQKKNFVEGSNGQGLAQMRSLYRYLTGRAIEVTEAGGFFTVKVPLM